MVFKFLVELLKYFMFLLLTFPRISSTYDYFKAGLEEIPRFVMKNCNTQTIVFSHNNLKHLSPEIGGMKRLKCLNLSNNQIKRLPKEVANLKSLRHINLSNNQFDEFPQEILAVNELRSLDISSNHIQVLPEEIISLKNLRIFKVFNNKIKLLPKGIKGLKRLKRLDIHDNKISMLPVEIGLLESLIDLNASNNRIKSLNKEIVNLKNLRMFYINQNKLETLPKEIFYLKTLTILVLNSNRITSIPAEVGLLSRLKLLSLYENYITKLPKQIEYLKNLKLLTVHDNHLTELPEEIGGLINLRKLYVHSNKIKVLPSGIKYLRNLETLSLNNNKLVKLPSEILYLNKLEELWIQYNELTVFPKEIKGLKNLKILAANNNKLLLLPNEIKYLKLLQSFDLSNNRLRVLLKEIKYLVNLQVLRLNGNLLTSLPKKITIFSNNTYFKLCVMNNPLNKHGGKHGLGLLELHNIFAHRVMLPRKPFLAVFGKGVYQRLSIKPLYWNFEMLRTIKLKQVPRGTLDGNEILDLWFNSLYKYQNDDATIENYIKTLYSIDGNAFTGLMMYSKFVGITKDLVEAIFKKLRDNIMARVEGAEDDARSYISLINTALKKCPDRQYSTFNMIYSALYYNKYTLDSLESLIIKQMSIIKNTIFEALVAPGDLSQNVHYLNYLKYLMKDELGLEIEYITNSEILDEQILNEELCQLIETFYNNFTPEYVIKNLAEMVNSKHETLVQAGRLLMGKINENNKFKDLFFKFKDNSDEDFLIPKCIKYKGIEQILLDMNILIENNVLLK